MIIELPCWFCSVSACSRTCQNGGTLDAGTCMCNCSGGFSGSNCESEFIVKSIYRVDIYSSNNDNHLYLL